MSVWKKVASTWEYEACNHKAIITKRRGLYWAKCYGQANVGGWTLLFNFPPNRRISEVKQMVENNSRFMTKEEFIAKKKEQYALDKEIALLGADEVEVFEPRRWYETYD